MYWIIEWEGWSLGWSSVWYGRRAGIQAALSSMRRGRTVQKPDYHARALPELFAEVRTCAGILSRFDVHQLRHHGDLGDVDLYAAALRRLDLERDAHDSVDDLLHRRSDLALSLCTRLVARDGLLQRSNRIRAFAHEYRHGPTRRSVTLKMNRKISSIRTEAGGIGPTSLTVTRGRWQRGR